MTTLLLLEDDPLAGEPALGPNDVDRAARCARRWADATTGLDNGVVCGERSGHQAPRDSAPCRRSRDRRHVPSMDTIKPNRWPSRPVNGDRFSSRRPAARGSSGCSTPISV